MILAEIFATRIRIRLTKMKRIRIRNTDFNSEALFIKVITLLLTGFGWEGGFVGRVFRINSIHLQNILDNNKLRMFQNLTVNFRTGVA